MICSPRNVPMVDYLQDDPLSHVANEQHAAASVKRIGEPALA